MRAVNEDRTTAAGTVQQPPPSPRHVGLTHLLVASPFGGVAACCWLLRNDEWLRGGERRVPWHLFAFTALAFDAVLAFLWLHAQWVPMWVFGPYFGVLGVVFWVAAKRYRGLRAHAKPMDHVDAVAVGWAFCAMRFVLGGGAWLIVRLFQRT